MDMNNDDDDDSKKTNDEENEEEKENRGYIWGKRELEYIGNFKKFDFYVSSKKKIRKLNFFFFLKFT